MFRMVFAMDLGVGDKTGDQCIYEGLLGRSAPLLSGDGLGAKVKAKTETRENRDWKRKEKRNMVLISAHFGSQAASSATFANVLRKQEIRWHCVSKFSQLFLSNCASRTELPFVVSALTMSPCICKKSAR